MTRKGQIQRSGGNDIKARSDLISRLFQVLPGYEPITWKEVGPQR